MFISNKVPSRRLIIYFHGNAQDIGQAEEFLSPLASELDSHILLVEYPTYGVYTNRELSEESICQDADHIFQHLVLRMGLRPSQIIVFGRSMGTGPSCYLASKYRNIGGLILFSAYKSVREAANSLVGSFLGGFVKERFNNIEAIQNVVCPVLFIHGKKDKMIPFSHTSDLYRACHNSLKKDIVMPSEMTHNEFRLELDFIDPIVMFMQRNQIGYGERFTEPKKDYLAVSKVEEVEGKEEKVKSAKEVEDDWDFVLVGDTGSGGGGLGKKRVSSGGEAYERDIPVDLFFGYRDFQETVYAGSEMVSELSDF